MNNNPLDKLAELGDFFQSPLGIVIALLMLATAFGVGMAIGGIFKK